MFSATFPASGERLVASCSQDQVDLLQPLFHLIHLIRLIRMFHLIHLIHLIRMFHLIHLIHLIQLIHQVDLLQPLVQDRLLNMLNLEQGCGEDQNEGSSSSLLWEAGDKDTAERAMQV